MQCALGPLHDEATGKTHEPVPKHERACNLCHRFNCSFHTHESSDDHPPEAQQQSWHDHKGAFVDTQAFETERIRPLRIPAQSGSQPLGALDPSQGLGNDHRLPCETCGTRLYSFEATAHRFCCRRTPALKVEPPADWADFLNKYPQLQQAPRLFNHLCSPVAFATSKRDHASNAEVRLHGRAYARVIPLQGSRINNTLERVSKEPTAATVLAPAPVNADDDSDDDSDDGGMYADLNDDADLLFAPTVATQASSHPRLPSITPAHVAAATTDRVYNVNNPARMYIYESEFESMLQHQNQDVHKKTAMALQEELKQHCPWAKGLMVAADKLKLQVCTGGIVIKQPSAAERSSHRTTTDIPAPNALAGLVFHDAQDIHQRSSACAPAVIFVNTDEPPRFLERRGHVYEPLTYPLLYPMGTVGYSCMPHWMQADVTVGNLPSSETTRVDPYAGIKWQRYCRQRLCRDFPTWGRLAQEWAIYQYLIHEDVKLNFLASAKGQEKVAGYRFNTA